jgi:hypothetical protein
MIPGVQRGGTTSLATYLDSHPRLALGYAEEAVDVFPDAPALYYVNGVEMMIQPANLYLSVFAKGSNKEPGYFNRSYGLVPLEAYLSLYTNSLTHGFDASVDYFDSPKVPARIQKVFPDMKFIILLRDTVSRAWSHYWHEVKMNRSENLPFLEAIQRKVETNNERFFYSYLERGHYAEHLERWFAHFPRENFGIFFSENLFADPQGVLLEVQTFLKLEDFVTLSSYGPMNKLDYPKMGNQTRRELRAYYAPHNRKLEGILDEGKAKDHVRCWSGE